MQTVRVQQVVLSEAGYDLFPVFVRCAWPTELELMPPGRSHPGVPREDDQKRVSESTPTAMPCVFPQVIRHLIVGRQGFEP